MSRATLLLLCLLVILPLGCAPPLGDSEADLALEDIVAGPGMSRLKQRTPLPSRMPLSYRVAGRDYRGDLYRPQDGARAGIVLVPGVVPAGKDDPRLVALAYTLARLQFAVLVPEIAGLRQYQVRSSDVRVVADAFRHLQSREDVPRGRVGIAGFSYGAGPVLLAGLEADIRQQVRFILALGGYYDLTSLVTFFTTGYYREQPDGGWRYRPPQPYAAWVFALSNVDLLAVPADRQRLRDHVIRLATEGDASGPPPAGLGQDGKALVALLQNRDPARVPALIASLSPRMRREMAGIDPSAHDLSQLRAQVILVHGRSDDIIPYTESIALSQVLEQVRPGQARLFLIDGFAHVDVAVERQDIPHLRRAMQSLLAQRASR